MSATTPWAALAVDWNGTIVNDVERAWHAAVDAVTTVGHGGSAPASIEQFRASFTLPMEAFFADLGVPEDAVEACVGAWNSAMLERPAGLTPGARQLLEAAADAGVPVIVISGAHELLVHQDSAQLGVETLLASVHGNAHPKRDILRRYATRGRIAYVGDTAYDVREGLAAGALTVAVDFGYGVVDDLSDADVIVSDLSELVHILGRAE